jgi:rod shape-determining protein MreC
MSSLVRRWGRYRAAFLWGLLVLGAASLIRTTQGQGIVDVGRWLVRPFKTDGRVQQELLDAQTQALQQRIQELEKQNQSLRALLDLPELPQRRKIAAAVLARSADNWWQQLTLSKGSTAGVHVDAVVVAPGGLVGRVVSVTATTSRVLLVSDPSSSVGVTVGRGRQSVLLQGAARQTGVLTVPQYLDEQAANVKVNDLVVTSALSDRFPPGIVVGRVTNLQPSERGAPRAEVKFTVPLDYLEWVNILVNG